MPPKSKLFFYFFVLLLGFITVAFQHPDLSHTVGSAYAILNGHLSDFYSYNAPVFGRNDYLPGIYLIFSLWMLPFKLAGALSDVTVGLSLTEILWAKALVVAFFFATVVMLWKTAAVAFAAPAQCRRVALMQATSPIAIFSVFVMGQYDVIGCFFMVCGLFFYFRREFFRFALMFALAVSIKYFPLAVFIPLLLLAPVNWFRRVQLGAIGVSFTAFQFLLCWGDATFRHNIFLLPANKLSERGGASFGILIACAASYALMCLLLARARPSDDDQWRRWSVLAGSMAAALMFCGISWHPQWLILATPFFCLACGYARRPSVLYVAEIVGVVSFTWIVANAFAYNVDVTMLQSGLFAERFASPNLFNRDLMPAVLLRAMRVVFVLHLLAPVALMAFESRTLSGAPRPFRSGPLVARFLVGVVVLLGPTAFCGMVGESLARTIEPQSMLYNLRVGTEMAGLSSPTGEILPTASVVQAFRVDEDNLAGVSARLSNLHGFQGSRVQMSLSDDAGTLVATSSIAGWRIRDNSFYGIRFDPVRNSAGRTFYLAIQSPEATPGRGVMAWKTSAPPSRFDGKLTMAGQPVRGALNMRMQYLP